MSIEGFVELSLVPSASKSLSANRFELRLIFHSACQSNNLNARYYLEVVQKQNLNVERSKSRGAFRRLSWRNYKGQVSLEALQNFKFNFKLSPNSIQCSLQ